MSRKIILTTESGSDLPKELQQEYGFRVLPMHVTMGADTYNDGDLPINKLFEYYEKTGDTPKSSACNMGDYIDFFSGLRKEDPDCVIYNIALSSGISTNYEHSVAAAEEFKDVYTIDSKVFGAGCNAYMIEAWKLLQARGGEQAITDYQGFANELQALAPRISSSFVPDSLQFLRAGGRVTNAAYIASNVFNIKPLIEPDELGRLHAGGRYRGKMIAVCQKYIEDTCAKWDIQKDTLYIMYVEGVADGVLEKMEQTAYAQGFQKVRFNKCGAVISIHGGKAAVGLGFVLNP